MRVILKPLTPIWTGNNEQRSDVLRVTGLMGSLRWWWEGIVRAYGHYACDPTEGGCILRRDDDPLCAGCRLFGATGWARRFRLTASGLSPEPWYVLATPGIARMHEGWLKRLMKNDAKVLWGDRLTLEFVRYLDDAEWGSTEQCLRGLLKVMCGFGAIGAKAQNGHGAVGLMERWEEKTGPAIEAFLNNTNAPPGKTNNPLWFNLARTAFLNFEVPDPGVYATSAVRIPGGMRARYDGLVLPSAYEIRYKSETEFRGRGRNVGLRPALKDFLRDLDIDAERIVGSTASDQNERTASRVFVTHLYRASTQAPFRFRTWVNVPDGAGISATKVGQFAARYLVREVFPGSRAGLTSWEIIKAAL